MQERFDTTEGKLKDVETSLALVKEVGEKMANIEKKTTENLERKLADLKDRGSSNNLIIFGIPKNTIETSESLPESVVQDPFWKKVCLQVLSVERLHRLGTRKSDRPQRVIIKLYENRAKMMIKSCFKLKGSNVSIAEDFSAATRQLRKHL